MFLDFLVFFCVLLFAMVASFHRVATEESTMCASVGCNDFNVLGFGFFESASPRRRRGGEIDELAELAVYTHGLSKTALNAWGVEWSSRRFEARDGFAFESEPFFNYDF